MTLRAEAYSRIREAILRREDAFANRTSERTLARTYFDEGSRTPVREALAVLAATGLVEQIPQVGVRVRRIESEEAIQAVRLRLGMEPVIVEQLAARGPLDDSGLREHLASMERADDPIEFMLADTDFHTELARLGGFSSSLTALQGLRDRVHLFRLLQPLSDEQRHDVLAEHDRIVSALAAGDRDAAISSVQGHLRETLSRIDAASEGHRVGEPVLAGSGSS